MTFVARAPPFEHPVASSAAPLPIVGGALTQPVKSDYSPPDGDVGSREGRMLVRILLLAPQPFFQARGTPIAVRTVLEFLGARGHQVDVLTYHEGSDVEIPNCRIVRIPASPACATSARASPSRRSSATSVMLVSCARMMRRTRYDLVHAVEESAFIAAAMQPFTGVPYVYDMDSSLAEQLIDAFPGADARGRRSSAGFEAVAVRRSAGRPHRVRGAAGASPAAMRRTPRSGGWRTPRSWRPPNGAQRRQASAGRRRPGAPVAMYVGQSRALPGDRPAAGGVPAHPGPDAAGPPGDRGRAGGRHRPLREAGLGPGHPSGGALPRAEAGVGCSPSSCARRTCWSPLASRASILR